MAHQRLAQASFAAARRLGGASRAFVWASSRITATVSTPQRPRTSQAARSHKLRNARMGNIGAMFMLAVGGRGSGMTIGGRGGASGAALAVKRAHDRDVAEERGSL